MAEESIFLYMTQESTVMVTGDWIQGFKQSGALNPMVSFLRIQFLEKYPNNIVSSTSPSLK